MGYYRTTALAGIALACCASAAHSETVLRFNNFLPPRHGQVVDVFEPWAKQVEEATEGRVRVEILPSSLAAPPRIFDLVESGGVDVAWGVPGYTTGRFTLARMLDLPFLGDNAEAISVAYWKVYREMFEAANEYRGVKVLTVYGTGPGTIYTNGAPPTSVGDLSGRKFRVSNKTAQEVAQNLGTVGVTSSAGEAHEMLSRNVVDGTFWTNEAYESFKLADVVDGQLTVPGGFYNSAVYIIVNQAKWDSLPPEDQEAIWSVSGESLARMGGQAWDKADTEAIALMADRGVTRVTAEGPFLEDIHTRLAPIEEAWIAEADAVGVDGRNALDRLRSLAGAPE